ncbi:Gfo/Idh/MocA family protein [Aquibacillus salsiterrae]|uniref:Gfo/Idh/MocA family oxidoreductase n=1 Tax=Aquibacillus salsiterrae TaxID=2950439 RepID=A0A9X4AF37_9BACI|nr:Gfo/Idh/MocA family oxidoreductase [Aquibacillus salsiterrae]MDC3415840.1 Gfo/Idh/MocA family oxidoreductase [Aquibacillus salsiterrae]
MGEKLNVGLIGCGNISSIYLKNLPTFGVIDVVACADIDLERAKKQANDFGVPKACSVDELLQMEEVDIVVNLTIPSVHAEISIQALEAGKHVYVEKPLAVTREDGKRVLEKAKEKGLFVGSAPDTVLGGGIQTCRKLIDDGWIGKPVAATAFMMGHGPERWHPNPDFFYQFGGGPMFDMGPYYLATLIHLLGPISRVTGSASISFEERTVTNPDNYGKKIPVEIPTHIAGVLDFASGAVGTLITSFDVWGSNTPFIEIYGSTGSLSVPDPNTFGGPIKIRKQFSADWHEIPITFDYTENMRGLGVADLAESILTGRKPRANGDVGYHILDIMHAIHESSEIGAHRVITSDLERPTPMGE